MNRITNSPAAKRKGEKLRPEMNGIVAGGAPGIIRPVKNVNGSSFRRDWSIVIGYWSMVNDR